MLQLFILYYQIYRGGQKKSILMPLLIGKNESQPQLAEQGPELKTCAVEDTCWLSLLVKKAKITNYILSCNFVKLRNSNVRYPKRMIEEEE